MKLKSLLIAALIFTGISNLQAQYNTLWIPDTLVGTTFNLTERDTFQQIIPGNQTITGGINGSFWGPTMIWNKGDVVHVNVTNKLTDTTTIHWHGMHLPAIMDGGPHQTIAPNTTWSPYWKVDNNAGFYWYHPHLDMRAEEQLNMGLGGFIIVRDPIESALALPRTYKVDDIPLVFTDRDFDGMNQFQVVPYGDSLLTNGVLRAQYNVPAQVIRLRLLDGAIERSYNVGFSDNRNFWVITTDGGLLDTPVKVNRLLIHAGERYEILVDCTGQNGTSVNLKAFNSALSGQIPGGESFPGGPFANALGHADFNLLHLNIGAPTASPITTIPSTLTTNTFYTAASAALTRVLTITDSTGVPGTLGPNAFILNHHLFNIGTIDYHVPLDNTEIWEIKSTSPGFGHPFHIHDVEFNILSINGAAPPAYQQGWKDVVFIPASGDVKFIAKFSDYSDSLHPYMFHCHIALHEDEGMMGQFVVGNSPSGIMNKELNRKMKLYPNPTKGLLTFEMEGNITITHATVINMHGQVVKEFELNTSKSELDVSTFANGLYFLRLTDSNGGSYVKSYLME